MKDRYTTFSLRVTKDEYQVIRNNLASVYKIDRPGLEIYIMALLKDFPQIIQGRIEEYKQLMKHADAIVYKKYGLIK